MTSDRTILVTGVTGNCYPSGTVVLSQLGVVQKLEPVLGR